MFLADYVVEVVPKKKGVVADLLRAKAFVCVYFGCSRSISAIVSEGVFVS